MLQLCTNEAIGVILWSPLAQGYLTRPHVDLTETTRGASLADRHEAYRAGGGPTINEGVAELWAEDDATMARRALGWLLQQDSVDAPIVGTTRIEHLEETVETLDLNLDDADVAWLEEPYDPVPVSGHE